MVYSINLKPERVVHFTAFGSHNVWYTICQLEALKCGILYMFGKLESVEY